MNGLLQDTLLDYRRRILELEDYMSFLRKKRLPDLERDQKSRHEWEMLVSKRLDALENPAPAVNITASERVTRDEVVQFLFWFKEQPFEVRAMNFDAIVTKYIQYQRENQ